VCLTHAQLLQWSARSVFEAQSAVARIGDPFAGLALQTVERADQQVRGREVEKGGDGEVGEERRGEGREGRKRGLGREGRTLRKERGKRWRARTTTCTLGDTTLVARGRGRNHREHPEPIAKEYCQHATARRKRETEKKYSGYRCQAKRRMIIERVHCTPDRQENSKLESWVKVSVVRMRVDRESGNIER
jgi:hypothetical protein